jgi:hypothetical protein
MPIAHTHVNADFSVSSALLCMGPYRLNHMLSPKRVRVRDDEHFTARKQSM